MKVRIKSTAEFIERASIIHNNRYDYSLVEYTGSDKKVTIICPDHGIFNQLANRHLSGTQCKQCSIIAGRQTCLDRYGVESIFQSKEFQSKIKQTNIERYGTEFASQSTSFRNKVKQTCLERYGANSPLESTEIQTKIKQAHIDNHGVDHHWKSEQVRKQITATMLDMYGVKFASQSKVITDKVNNTNLVKYGVIRPQQNTQIHNNTKQTNIKKYGTEYPQQAHLSQETIRLMNSSEYLTEQHHVNRLSLSKIADTLGVDGNVVLNRFSKFNIEKLRFPGSQGEREVLEFLNSNNINTVGNTRTVITPLELDIYLPDHNIAIEYCGLYWHCDQFRSKTYHQEKYQTCLDKNIRLITIFEDEWLTNQNLVKNKLLHILNLSQQPKIFARKCQIKEVNSKHKRIFYDQNHIQGNGPGSLTYGLYYNDQLVSCMTFIVKQGGIFELNRYATSHNVVGGFSRLLSHFKNNNEYTKIISFADLRWSDGNMYEKNGFTLDGVVPPTYEYVINNRRIHRSNFMRIHLPKRLGEMFDPNLTEFQNMDRAGIPRIWNCGLLRYVINV